jgi:hypothetical protein
MSEEEVYYYKKGKNWEHEYPPGSLGYKINRKIDAVEEHALKSGKIFLSIFAVLFATVVIEVLVHPFQLWREGLEPYNLAMYHTILYAVTLLFIGGFFFYYGVRLVWHGRKLSNR